MLLCITQNQLLEYTCNKYRNLIGQFLRGLMSRSNIGLPRAKKDALCNSSLVPRPKCHGYSWYILNQRPRPMVSTLFKRPSAPSLRSGCYTFGPSGCIETLDLVSIIVCGCPIQKDSRGKVGRGGSICYGTQSIHTWTFLDHVTHIQTICMIISFRFLFVRWYEGGKVVWLNLMTTLKSGDETYA